METCKKINWPIDPNRDDEFREDLSFDACKSSIESDLDIKCSQRKLSKQSSLFVPSKDPTYFETVVKYLQFQYLKLRPKKEISLENTVSA